MCRWIAYRGETIPLEQYVTAPAHSLVVQSQRALESTAATNGDGFGMGWYGEHAEPGLYREVRPAWSDENLRYLCRHIRSHLYFAHVRAATGTPITRPNCHPFACGRWLFMHNGMIGNWGRLRRKVEALIPDAFYGSRIGTTDSEAVFLAILGAGGDKDPVGATARVLATLTELVSTDGYREPLRSTPPTTTPTRSITGSPAATWWWCPSRSMPTARIGNRCRPATRSWRATPSRSRSSHSWRSSRWRRRNERGSPIAGRGKSPRIVKNRQAHLLAASTHGC